jgi:DeoR/GlpR family transcriptional regulator of sugar metabolism
VQLVAQRKELVLHRLARDGRLVAKEFAAEFDVSEDAIRRDLRELAEAGLCQRVYGGSVACVSGRGRLRDLPGGGR